MQEFVEQKKKLIRYVKLHVPWETLSVYAEYLLLRAPLQVRARPLHPVNNVQGGTKKETTKFLSNNEPIFKILSLTHSAGNLQSSDHGISHHTFYASLHYLVKYECQLV